MLCPRCQTENREGRRFCSKCGAPLAAACQSCGFTNEPGDEFCGGCGARLGAAQPAQTKFTSPDIYTPKHLAEKILTSKAALEGERKQVTVLFADLKGSMELLADRDPEEARTLLDPVLELMMEAVHRYEGTVNQVMGDGIMALFGAPLAHEDHAVRACYAALRMQDSVKRYAEDVFRSHGVTVRMRAGLNSGDVVVRAIGSDLRMDYTAVGQTTHLAARMEQLADPGATLLTAATLQLAEGFVEVKGGGRVPIKGLAEPAVVYELAGAQGVRSRLHAAAARGLTRFVGREGELHQLRHALERAGAGHGQVAAVVGQPGVGKSRLFWEFIHSHRTQGWFVLETGSTPYGKTAAYLPVIDLLKTYFQVEGRDDTRTIREKVTGKLLSLDRRLGPSLPALLSLLDVPVEDTAWEALDPPQRRRRTLDAAKHLLLRESQVQPLVVVIEDLHWIDTETQAWLDSLVEALPAARILLLINYRPEYQHGWGSKASYQQLRVDPLPAEGADDLLGGLLGADTSLNPLKRTLIERTEGNPLFLEESVRTLVETGALAGERGTYRLPRQTEHLQIPASVQAILAARIDRLAPEDKRLLQAAAVIGKDVPMPLLLAIAEVRDGEVRAGMERLQAAEFLHETRLFPDLEYTFKHALTHEVAYGGLLHDRQRALHARVTEAIERLSPERVAEQAERLAHHALRGELWEKAVAHLRQAGLRAMARGANREAMARLNEALAALDHLPRSRDTSERAVDIRVELHHALFPLPERGLVVDHLREAERLAVDLDDRPRLGRILAPLANEWWFLGDYESAVETGERALSIGTALGDVRIKVMARSPLGRTHHSLGNFGRAKSLYEDSLRELGAARKRDSFGLQVPPYVESSQRLAWTLVELGDFAEGLARAEEIAEICQSLTNWFGLAHALFTAGLVHLRRGDFQSAIPVLEQGIELCRSREFPVLMLPATAHLGYAYALAGPVARALPLLEESVREAERLPMAWSQSLWAGWWAEALLLAGRADDAAALGQRALGLAVRRKERGQEAYAHRLLGEIASREERPGVIEAVRHYSQAMSLANERGMRPLVAHCHLGFGKLSRRTGKREQAQEHLATATTMYREMDMRFWLAQAEAELKELGA